jgi:hypothetical protein
MSFTRIIISNHNWKISELKFKERMKRYEKWGNKKLFRTINKRIG